MKPEQAIADMHLIYRVAGTALCSPTSVKKVLRGERAQRIRGTLTRVLIALDAEGVDTPERLARLAEERTAPPPPASAAAPTKPALTAVPGGKSS